MLFDYRINARRSKEILVISTMSRTFSDQHLPRAECAKAIYRGFDHQWICIDNTAWIKFKAGGTDTNNIPDPRLSDIDIKVADMKLLEPALQQARNVLLMTHRGIEDFEFDTQENQVENINRQITNARLSGGVIAIISPGSVLSHPAKPIRPS